MPTLLKRIDSQGNRGVLKAKKVCVIDVSEHCIKLTIRKFTLCVQTCFNYLIIRFLSLAVYDHNKRLEISLGAIRNNERIKGKFSLCAETLESDNVTAEKFRPRAKQRSSSFPLKFKLNCKIT